LILGRHNFTTSGQWPHSWTDVSINFLEIAAVYRAVQFFGTTPTLPTHTPSHRQHDGVSLCEPLRGDTLPPPLYTGGAPSQVFRGQRDSPQSHLHYQCSQFRGRWPFTPTYASPHHRMVTTSTRSPYTFPTFRHPTNRPVCLPSQPQAPALHFVEPRSPGDRERRTSVPVRQPISVSVPTGATVAQSAITPPSVPSLQANFDSTQMANSTISLAPG
jgi:hypothetical protein